MAILFLALVFTAGCQDELVSVPPDEVTPFPTTLEVEPSSVTLTPNDTAQVSAEPVDANGNVVPDKQVSWTSEDTAVAVVIADGTVVGKGAGSTRVVAYTQAGSDSIAAEADVTVTREDSTGTVPGPARTAGALEVSSQTSGDDVDGDGYTVTVDGDLSESLDPNGTVSFADLDAGDYTIELSGIANNCSVSSNNPRTLSVAEGDTTSTSFAVRCEAIEPESGTIEVSAATSGEDADSDGYTVTVDGDLSESLDPNGTASFPALEAGDYTVGLTGVASNCSVEGDNPLTVSVEAGNSASASFDVSCEATTGDLDISTQTSGEDTDTNGYTVTVDGSLSEILDPNGTVSFADLDAGDYTVELSGVQANCSVEGNNPLTISVEAGSSASASFNVSCKAIEPESGTIEVSAVTSGEDIDSNGYSVTVDGDLSESLDPNGTASFPALEAGDYTVGLTGVASNCSVEGDNPLTVSVEAGNTASTSFNISCQAQTGNLDVSVSTTGTDQDADGYAVSVNDAAGESVDPNGTVSFADLDAGDYTVGLTGVASNCSVEGDNPLTVSVEAGNTASTSFNISCQAQTGNLDVSVSTTGTDQDADGYAVSVNDAAGESVDPNGTVSFADLDAGDYTVGLTGVASNCSVEGDNPLTVSVEAGNTASTSFNISCQAQTGDLEVSAATSGEDVDSDGYTVTVDGDLSESLDPNGTASFPALEAGDYSVELTGIASNCSVEGDNPRSVSVDAGNTASPSFDVRCENTSEPMLESATINSTGNQITLAFDQAVTLGPNHSDSDFPNLHNTPDTNPTFIYSTGEGTTTLSFTLSEIVNEGVEPILDYNQPGDGIETTSGGVDLLSFSGFAVTNNSTQRGKGDLEVSAATSGSNQDTDGYTVAVERVGSRSIGPNGTASFLDLETGDYSVEFTGVANNCSVEGDNPRSVSVEAGNTVSASFNVSCEGSGGIRAVEIPSASDFTDHGAILQPGSCGQWDWWLTNIVGVVRKGNTYFLYYQGADGMRNGTPGGSLCDDSDLGDPHDRHTGVATASATADITNPNSWTKYHRNPVIEHQPGTKYTGEAGTLMGDAFLDGNTIRLYIGGMQENAHEDVDSDIVHFTSGDGTSTTNQSDAWTAAGTGRYNDENFPAFGIKVNGIYQLYFTGADAQGRGTLYRVESANPRNFHGDTAQKVSGIASGRARGQQAGAIWINDDEFIAAINDAYAGTDAPISIRRVSKNAPNALGNEVESWDFPGDHIVPKLYLDRQAGRWILVYQRGAGHNRDLRLKTAPVTYR